MVIPYPPSANRYWRRSGQRIHRSELAVAYCEVVQQLARMRIRGPVSTLVRITADVYRPRAAGDLTNTIKVLEDALKGIVYDDDEQTAEVLFRRWEDPDAPRVQLEVEEADPARRPGPRWASSEAYERLFAVGVARLDGIRADLRRREKARAEVRELAKRRVRPDVPPPSYPGESLTQRMNRMAKPNFVAPVAGKVKTP